MGGRVDLGLAPQPTGTRPVRNGPAASAADGGRPGPPGRRSRQRALRAERPALTVAGGRLFFFGPGGVYGVACAS